MGLPFLQSATGDPKELALRYAWQDDKTIPPPEADYVDFYPFSSPYSPSRATVDAMAIQADGAPLERIRGKRAIPARAIEFGDLDPTNLGQLFALLNWFGKYTVTSKNSGGWFEWVLSREEATAIGKEAFAALVDDNVLPRRRAIGNQINELTIAADPNGNLTLVANGGTEQFDYFAVPTQSVGSGSTLPDILGVSDEHYLEAADSDNIVFTVTDVTNIAADPDPRVTVQAAIGGAAASHSFTVYLGRTDNRVFDQDGQLIGPPGDPMRIHWPEGATLTATDEFTVDGDGRAAWSPSGLTRFAMPAVNTRLMVDGVQSRIEGGWSLTLSREIEELDDVYGEQSRTIDVFGDYMVQLELSRRIRNLDFQKILHEDTEVSLVIDGETETKVDTGQTPQIPYRWIFIAPELKSEGDQFMVEPGAENRQESITLYASVPASAFSYDPGYGESAYSISTHAAIVLWTSHADIGGLS